MILFSFERLDIELFHQNSTVFESILLKVCNNHYKHQSYVIGSIYRRPSELIADLTQFTDEFSAVLSNVNVMCNQAYIDGDLLQLHINNHYNSFYENVTSQGFFPKISRPTRSFENSHSLIDNIFSNNLCKPPTSSILTHHISDHFMNFWIVESKTKKIPIPTYYIEVENVDPKSVADFRNCVATCKSELISQFDNNPYTDPNHNYNILSFVIEKA